jgi:hypothetical protein
MKQDTIEAQKLTYSPCRYGSSRTLFRGPRRRLDKPYVAFIGGTETFGKYIERPFPNQVEATLQRTCVNLGSVYGGIEAYLKDPAVMDICRAADMTVVQVMGANLLSNRFYSVHPRRNDRFMSASTVLKAIYGEVDFSQFTFARQMLVDLHARSAERFGIVVDELQQAWVARMQLLLREIGGRTILLWFADEETRSAAWFDGPEQLFTDPLFVTAGMLDKLRPMTKEIVVVTPSDEARALRREGMVTSKSQAGDAAKMLGMTAHSEASAALVPVLRKFL